MEANRRHPQFSTKGLVAHYKLWAGLTSTANVFDYSLNGNIGTPGGTDIAPAYPGFSFNGTDDRIVASPFPSSYNTIMMWIKLADISGTENIISTGIDSLRSVTGTLTAITFSSGTAILYTDAVAADVDLSTDWHMIGITSTAAITTAFLQIGNKDTVWFEGKIGETMLYDRVLSPAEVKSVYELTKWRYPNN